MVSSIPRPELLILSLSVPPVFTLNVSADGNLI